MRISYNWLQEYFDAPLPSVEELRKLLTMHAFEVESIERVGVDTVLDIKVLPDRSHDCLCHIGIAREVSVLANMKLKSGLADAKEISAPESNVLRVDIEDTKKCKRFSALVIENVEVKESPDWLKARLESMGQRSVNNVVDATNFVMFNMGQPLHAYDRDLLTEDGGVKIVVRSAKNGEVLTALDNKEYTCDENDLLIVNGNTDAPLGVAGVKGGKACEITSKTKHIVLEAANFDSISVRKTAKKLGLRTDASVRFENEITPEITLRALKEVSDLLFRIAKTDETQVEGLVDIYPTPSSLYKLGVSLSEIQNVLGIQITQKAVEEILLRRGYAFQYVESRDVVTKLAPQLIGVPYKLGASILRDAPRFFDCSSLASYLYAQGGVSIPRMTVDQLVFGEEIQKEDLVPGDLVFSNSGVGNIHKKSIEYMKGTEVPSGVDHVGIYMGGDLIIHASKPVGSVVEEHSNESNSFKNIVGYRRFLFDSEPRFVLTIPAERLDLRIKEDLIEEIGRVYGYEAVESKRILVKDTTVEIEKSNHYVNILRKLFVEEGFSEVITYVFRDEGEVLLQNPLASDKAYLRANLADGMSEALSLNNHNKDLLGLGEIKIFEIGNVFTKDGEFLSLAFAGGKVDELKKKVEEVLGVELPFVERGDIREAHLGSVLSSLSEPKYFVEHNSKDETIRFKTFSSYPFVLRDIAVFVPEGESEGDIIETAKKASENLLVNFRLFDTFTKEFPEGKKTSYAYRLVFQSMDKTLSDEEINPIMEKVSADLNAKPGWQVR